MLIWQETFSPLSRPAVGGSSWSVQKGGSCLSHGRAAGNAQHPLTPKLQDLVQLLLRKPVALIVKEDNTACIQAVRKGYSPALRHMPRTQRVSLGDLHETFEERQAQGPNDGPVLLEHQDTKQHKGDVFTKYMEPTTYNDALTRLGVSRASKHVAKSLKQAGTVGGAPALETRRGPK